MSLFIVHKKFSDGSRDYEPNDVVELDGRNLKTLESQRYISKAPDGSKPSAVKAKVSPTKKKVGAE